MRGADHPHATAIATAKVTPIIGDLSSEGRCSELWELGRPFPKEWSGVCRALLGQRRMCVTSASDGSAACPFGPNLNRHLWTHQGLPPHDPLISEK